MVKKPLGTAFFKQVTPEIEKNTLMIFVQKVFLVIFRIHYILYIEHVISILDANLI